MIYDDPPEFCETPRLEAKKRTSVHDYLSEMWKRNRPEGTPPPPPVPDYRGAVDGEPVNSISESLAYDVYAALEDPNNWDPPEQFWSPNHESHAENADGHQEGHSGSEADGKA